MKYTIFQVDDSRQGYVDNIRGCVGEWDDVGNLAVDGRNPGQLMAAQMKWQYRVTPNSLYNFPLKGHLGIWYGILNAIEQAPIVTFEDDAIIDYGPFFTDIFEERIAELPDDADFFTLFIPRDNDQRFKERHEIDKHWICRVYQPYGGVSMYFTERGKDRIFKLLDRDGITDQWDNQFMNYSWHGELNGYTSKPIHPDLVRISGVDPSIVQTSERH